MARTNFVSADWRKLKMHAPHRALLPVEGNIGLGDDGLQPMRCKFMLAESAREKAPRILSPLDIDHECALELCLGKDHVDFSCDAVWRGRIRAKSNQSEFMGEKRLRIAFGRATFHTAQPRQPKKRLGVEPLL